MSIGITLDQLRQKLSDIDMNPSLTREHNLIVDLIGQCVELEPWLLIDETTPKDKEIKPIDANFDVVAESLVSPRTKNKIKNNALLPIPGKNPRTSTQGELA